MKKITAYMTVALLLAACSTTKHLPEGEVLYTGQKAMIVHNPPRPRWAKPPSKK